MTMDETPPTSQCDSAVNKQYSAIEIELYYLMVKYLSAGPCKKAFEVLKAEIEENELLPKRYDWLGNEGKKTFSEFDCQNSHVRKDHLLRLVSRLGPAIDQLVKLPRQSISSLLGTGSQSLLRKEEDLWKRYRTLSDVLVRRHKCPPLEPIKVRGPPCLAQTLLGRELLGNLNRKHVVTEKFYKRIQLFLRSIGHLSAVYCMLFDRTGKYIITGADDMLVKIWSTLDGRLMATLRGASAEISDLAIDSENSLIAAGSCDKIIRVWSLQTLAPVAVLSSHTGVITALQFCPAPDNEGVLISTGGDGCVCFWTYIRRNDDVRFDLKPLKVNERIRPGNAQLICASFSHGGNFLAVGGVDHFVRVYHLGGEDGVEKLLEAERHQDRVDSIQWCHKGLRFITGSRDGTALIWYYERQGWQNIVLNMTERFPGDDPPPEEIRRLQVTMVGWNRTDEYVITASNDKWLRVWESATGQLKQILKGHEDNAYVIEAHPSESRLILTAGHDGQLMIWDIFTGTLVWDFKNTIEGQGYGALFDAKWSPDGFMIASTDSHGHLVLFGIGHNEKFKKIPKELFFHTDYRPLMRDSNHHVLDEQTQMAPHLMPPPFLVNMDGDPYPPEYQRLVPGRENCRHDQLIPNVILNANGDQEVIDAAPNYNDLPPPPSVPPPPAAASLLVPESAHGPRLNIDEMIQRLAEEQDQRIAHDRVDIGGVQPGPSGVADRRESTSSSRGERRPSSSGPTNDHSYAVASLHDPLSPRASRVGARRVGDVEGVRQSTGNWQRDPNIKWNRRVIVRRQRNAMLIQSLERRKILGELELQIYDEESRKKPEPVRLPEEPPQEPERKTRKKQKKTPAYVTRSVRDSRRNSYDGNEAEDHAEGSPSPKTSSGSEIENDDLQESSSSDEQSTDYSDWTAEAGVNLEPPKRTAHKQKKSPRKRKRKKRGSDFEENDKDEEDEEDEKLEESRNAAARVNQRVQRQPRGPRPNLSEISGGADEIPEEFRPPEWLTETFPKKAPYFPQMGDELIYFMQGHMLYVEAVMNRKLYTIDKRNLPWMRTVNKLRDQEYVKIIGVKYEIKPPRLCCLKLGILEAGTGKLTSDSFTIKYHDMPDVLDFLILKATYDVAVNRHWRTGDRFRCIIDDAWWFGTVERQEPHLPEFPDSMFMCYRVLWDNGEQERLSPWDMEIIDEESADVVERGGSLAVKQDELEDLLYTPCDEEWAGRNPDLECDRISYGLSKIMSLAIAEPFLVPVDLNDYPMYALIIDYPMDLTTIKSRLDNRFYRRINAVQFDVRYLATNTEKFNQKGSNIVRQARIVTELSLELIKDGTCTDPTQLYHQLQANYHSPDHSGDECYERGESRFKNYGKSVKGRTQGKIDKRTWQQMCKDLLKSIFEREDSMPFRYPVDLDRYPDYSQVIEVPMDLTTVREELSTSAYETPLEFAKDMRLIFLNSKNYNTNKRSRIYSMTLRLEAYFEDQIKSILAKYNQGKRGQVKTNLRSQKGKLGSTSVKGASGSSVTSGFRRGVQKRLPSPGLSLPSASGTRSGTAGKLGGTRTKQGPSTGSSDCRSGLSTTAFGRAVVPPYRAEFSHSASYGKGINELDYDDDDEEEDDEENGPTSSKDGTRRSRRVAKKTRHQVDFNDSGEEYNPRNKQKNSAKKSKKKGVATRNRGKVTVQYNEDSDYDENKLSLKNKGKTKISSDESDDSEGSNSNGLRTNGQIYVSKNRLHSSSESESDERSKASNNSGGMNGIASKKIDITSKRSVESEGSESDNSSESGSDSSSSNSDITGKSERNKFSGAKRLPLSSDDSCDSTSIGKKPIKKSKQPSKGQYGQRKMPKDESEVEFDDEDLESSTEDSADDEDLKKGRKRGGVGSNVRRARKIILDGDDDLDADFEADHDFIDDADLSQDESSSESESEDGSDDLTYKKKKEKKKPKPAKKKITKKNIKKQAKKKNPPKKKQSSKNVSKKTPAKSSNKNKSPVKKTSAKKAPVNKNAGPSTKRNPVKREHFQELISLTQPGQAPIPFQPINTAGQKVIVNEVKHKGRVVGRVITSQYADDDETDSSEDSEESSYSSDDEASGNIINSARPLPPPIPTIQLPIGVKRIYESDSESEMAEGWQSQKRTRNDDECDEVDVSSRGRVRKANTLMRDFI
ncbi:bromodomain and WD repeat-containing protein 3 isoform X2 [Palaemon carinicauda]|uniref:bromodomain and WD repeat-containing protein 3 isoform X2 n=1 Tax=Palaemon carinicauda TaxID=392227 RepID=UPI0035B65FC5